MSCEDEIGVDFIADHEHAMFEREHCDSTQLVAAETASGRIMRIAQQQHPHLFAHHCAFERIEIDLAVDQRRCYKAAEAVAHAAQERRIDRRLYQDRVARRAQRFDAVGETAYDIWHQQDCFGIEPPLPSALRPLGEALRNSRALRHRSVTQIAAVDRFEQRGTDWRGGQEIHIGDPCWQHVWLVARPLAATVST
jgi:hypothetical protein